MSDDLDIGGVDIKDYLHTSADPEAALKELGFIFKGTGNNKSHWLRKLGRGWYESVVINDANEIVYRKVKLTGRGLGGEFKVHDFKSDATLNDIRRKVMKWKHEDAITVISRLLDSTEDNPDALDPRADLDRLLPNKCTNCGSSNLSACDTTGLCDCYNCGAWFNPIEQSSHIPYQTELKPHGYNRLQHENENEDDPDDPMTFINAMEMPNPRITVTYSQTTPESVEQGDTSASGYIDEEGKPMTPDEFDYEEGLGVADLAVKFLTDEGAVHASASHFHPGVWYSTEYQTIDYRTGTDEERCFHLVDFSEAEELDVWNKFKNYRNHGRHR